MNTQTETQKLLNKTTRIFLAREKPVAGDIVVGEGFYTRIRQVIRSTVNACFKIEALNGRFLIIRQSYRIKNGWLVVREASQDDSECAEMLMSV